jgi:hypothetical protein
MRELVVCTHAETRNFEQPTSPVPYSWRLYRRDPIPILCHLSLRRQCPPQAAMRRQAVPHRPVAVLPARRHRRTLLSTAAISREYLISHILSVSRGAFELKQRQVSERMPRERQGHLPHQRALQHHHNRAVLFSHLRPTSLPAMAHAPRPTELLVCLFLPLTIPSYPPVLFLEHRSKSQIGFAMSNILTVQPRIV